MAGVGYQRHIARVERGQNLLEPRSGRVFVIADNPWVSSNACEELAGNARVFCRDQRDITQCLGGAFRQVPEVSDRGSDHVQDAFIVIPEKSGIRGQGFGIGWYAWTFHHGPTLRVTQRFLQTGIYALRRCGLPGVAHSMNPLICRPPVVPPIRVGEAAWRSAPEKTDDAQSKSIGMDF